VADDDGVALLITLLIVALLAALAAALLGVTDLERLSAATGRRGASVFYASDAALECVIQDLSATPDWTVVLAGGQTSALDDGAMTPVAAWGQTIDLAALTTALQVETTAATPLGANTPRWRLFLHASLRDLVPAAAGEPWPYLVAWVADDPGETDDDPFTDANLSVQVRARAIGMGGMHRDLAAVVERDAASDAVRLVSWRAMP
jgi:hypothetical protein